MRKFGSNRLSEFIFTLVRHSSQLVPVKSVYFTQFILGFFGSVQLKEKVKINTAKAPYLMTYAWFFVPLSGCSVLAVGEGVCSGQAVHTVLNPFALPKTGFCDQPGTVSLCCSLSFHLLACVCWCDTSWAELSFCCAKGWGSDWETPCRDREALCFGNSCHSVDERLTFCLCFPFHLLN